MVKLKGLPRKDINCSTVYLHPWLRWKFCLGLLKKNSVFALGAIFQEVLYRLPSIFKV